jgi:hypothetical protein
MLENIIFAQPFRNKNEKLRDIFGSIQALFVSLLQGFLSENNYISLWYNYLGNTGRED